MGDLFFVPYTFVNIEMLKLVLYAFNRRMDPKKDHHQEAEVEEEALEADSEEASLVVVVDSAAAEVNKTIGLSRLERPMDHLPKILSWKIPNNFIY